MLVSLLRARLTAAVRRGDRSYTDAELDYALQGALHDLDLSIRAEREIGAVTMTTNNPQLNVQGLCGLLPNRVIRAEIGFRNRGVWASGTAYIVGDIVTGDGDPDAYFYACTTANTAASGNEPGTEGGQGLWEMRLWKRGNKIEVMTYTSIARLLGDSQNRLLDPLTPYVYQVPIQRGMPINIGFLDSSTAYLYPVPTAAWRCTIIQDQAIDEWEAGVQNPNIDLPSAVLFPMTDIGAAWWLEPSTGDGQTRQVQWERMKNQLRGRIINDVGIGVSNESLYLDHSDVLPWRRL